MAGWWNRIFGNRPAPKAPLSREERDARRAAQNDWIKGQFESWQAQWHDIFDQDQALLATGEFDRDDPLPDDINSDYRLIFGLSRASPDTRAKCFAVLPHGPEMHQRFEHYMTGTPEPMDAAQARAMLADLGTAIDACDPNEQVDWGAITVMDQDSFHNSDISYNADSPSILLERSLLEPHDEKALPGIAASLFLTEPLYASCGNYYELADWVTAVAGSEAEDKVHRLRFQLWFAGWQVFLTDNGVLLVRRTG